MSQAPDTNQTCGWPCGDCQFVAENGPDQEMSQLVSINESLKDELEYWEGSSCGGDCFAAPCEHCDGTRWRQGEGARLKQLVSDLTEDYRKNTQEICDMTNELSSLRIKLESAERRAEYWKANTNALAADQRATLGDLFTVTVLSVAVRDVDEACRVECRIGNQTFHVGPDYWETREEGEAFAGMLRHALGSLQVRDSDLNSRAADCMRGWPTDLLRALAKDDGARGSDKQGGEAGGGE